VWAEISATALRENRKVTQTAAGMSLLAVVKADAYGHGAEICAPVLAAAGAKWLGVTSVDEGVRVRQALGVLPQGMSPRVLVMCGIWPGEVEAALRHSLTAVVWEPYHLDLLEEVAAAMGLRDVPVHVEVDTGMARQGVLPGPQLLAIAERLRKSPWLHLEGLMTHLASAEVSQGHQTVRQMELFAAAVRSIGKGVEIVHVGNTSGVDTQESMVRLRAIAAEAGAVPMSRAGLALYGYALPVEGGAGVLKLQPVMAWKTRIVSLREVQAGETVGYNATFVAPRTMRLALLPVGYADGLRRELSSPAGAVRVRGQRTAVVGRVSMDLTLVDVTAIPEAAIGDEVVLIGDGVSAGDHARWAGTIPYEILCGVSERVPRVLVP